MTQLQIKISTIRSNPNIIPKKGHHKTLFKEVEELACVHCDERFPFDTSEKVYLFNAHGWVICNKCMKIYNIMEAQNG